MKVVLNDENLANDYGFKILNSGIDLERFKKNNVVLYRHKDGDLAIGNVNIESIKVEGSQLVGDVEFDKEDTDPEVQRLISKYERGVMKGFSLGLMIYEIMETVSPLGKSEYVATKSEMYELSACSIPSNKNAVKLMNSEQTLVTLMSKGQKVNLSVHDGKIDFSTIKVPDMDFKKLASTLGLPDTATQTDIEAKAVEMKAQLESKTAELVKLQSVRVDAAIKEGETAGVITDGNRDAFKTMLASNYDATKAVIDAAKPAKVETLTNDPVTLKAVLASAKGGQTPSGEGEETFDFLQKKNPTKLAALKVNDPAKYAALASDYQKGVRYTA